MEINWLAVILFITVFYLLYKLSTRNHDYWAKKGVPFEKPLPAFGNLATVIFRRTPFIKYFQDVYERNKNHKFVGLYESGKASLLIIDPQLIKDITVKSFDYFQDRRSTITKDIDPLFGASLLNLSGGEWRAMRNRLSPAFTTSKLKAMFPIINRCAEKFSDYLIKRSKNSEPLEFKEEFTRLTNDIIAIISFGHNSNAISNPKDEFYLLASDLTKFSGIKMLRVFGYMIMPSVMKFFGVKVLSPTGTTYFQNLIKSAMEYRKKTKQTRSDMLDLLMAAQKEGGIESAPDDENDSGRIGEDEHAAELHKKHLKEQTGDQNLITDEDIEAQAFLFFFAGFETVATIMTFIAYELAVNPDIQEKLYEEITKINNEKLTYDKIQSLKYLDMVVSETLRKYPAPGLLDRKCVKNYKLPETDVIIEKDTVLMFPIYAIHNDPNYYPNPDKFDPERFNDENKKNIKPYTFLPFGSGPHNCIGMRMALMELKTCIFQTIKSCELKVCDKTEIPIKLSKKDLQLTSDNGFWLCAEPRSYDI